MMNWKISGRKGLWPNLKKAYYLGIRLEGLRKTAKPPRDDSRSPGRDFNPGSPEYEAVVLTTRPRRPVLNLIKVELMLRPSAI
jgi:hypothetical protein